MLAGGRAIRVLAAMLVLLHFGCSARNSIQLKPNAQAVAQCLEKQDCSAPIQPGVNPSQEELCLLEFMRPRCDAVDKCFFDCITTGHGQKVAGGCFHVCGWVFTRVKGKLYKCSEQITPEWCACVGMAANCGEVGAPAVTD